MCCLCGEAIINITPCEPFCCGGVYSDTGARENRMDKDRVVGAAHQVKGAVKEAVGKVTGDAKTQTEGAAERAAGKVQNAVGGAKDAVREAGKEVNYRTDRKST